ncbi:hypothetical protein N9052_02530 [bacterium]|nr:hypothetical protein [bacterium]
MQRMLAAEIVSLTEDSSGQVFALAENGRLYVYSESVSEFVQIGSASDATTSKGRQLVFNKVDVLAVRFEQGLSFYFRPSITNANSIRPQNLPEKINTRVTATEKLGFCGGTEERVVCGLNKTSGEQTTVFNSPKGTKILEISYIKSTNELCVLLDDYRIQFFELSGLGVMRQLYVPELSGSELRSMRYLDGQLFFATDRGLLFGTIDNAKIKRLDTNKYIAITDVSLSPQGLWVLSENGMAYLAASRSDSWRGQTQEESLEILGFAENGQTGVFIATYDGIFHWDRISDSHAKVWSAKATESDDSRITSLSVIDGQLSAGTFNDGFRIFEIASEGRLIQTAERYLRDRGITTIKPLKHGLLIGTDSDGLHYFNNGGVSNIPMPLEWRTSPSPITSITKLSQHDGYLATTEDHAILLCTDRPKPYACSLQSAQSGALRPRIISSASDSDGSIWLGTLSHGLLKSSVTELQQGKPLRQSPLYSTHNLSIYAVVRETPEALWAATNNGLLVIDTGLEGSRRLGKIHGLSNIDFNHGASLKTEEELFFGGHFGYDKLKREIAATVDHKSGIWLRALTIDGRSYRYSKHDSSLINLSVAPRQKTIEFHLTVNDYRLPMIHQYQHKLEGFDTDWQDTGNVNVATYQNLPPGNYTFRARGADSTGVWSDNEVNLPIEVLPPLWRSWWALLSYLVLALGILIYLKRLNDQHVAHNERLKLAEEGSAAFARLEDDYQAQREANEALLLRRAPSAKALLDVVETALTAQLADTDSDQAASALVSKLRVLHSLQTLTDRTTSQERTDLHAVTEEIAARLAASNEVAACAIISNEVCKDPVPMEHAVYMCLVIQEALELAVTGRRFESLIDPLVFISMSAATLTENNECCYELHIEDSGMKDEDTSAAEQLLPLTFHLIESGGGELSEDYDAGNILTIKLLFPANPSL